MTSAIIAVAFVGFAVVSRRLSRSALTGTMVFTALGVALGPEGFDVVDYGGLIEHSQLISLVLTGTLVIVLFTDASAINSSNWRDDVLPARLLGIGLPVAIGLGWLLAAVLLGALEFWEAAVLGAMLAPTDAALGKAVVSNERVPRRIRQALNIESGLNDGIALPLFIVFLETAMIAEESLAISEVFVTLFEQVGIALLVGIAVGWIGALAIAWGRSSGAALGYWLEIGLVGLAVAAYAIATPLGGSGFIAAWVAGYVFGTRYVSAGDDPLPEFAEAFGDLLTMVSFVVFGIFLGPVLVDLTWQIVVFGVLSLAAVRMIAVAVALLGAKMRWQSVVLHRLVRSAWPGHDDPHHRGRRRERAHGRVDDRRRRAVHRRAQRPAPRTDRLVGIERIRGLRRIAPEGHRPRRGCRADEHRARAVPGPATPRRPRVAAGFTDRVR